jgi:uncharacterized protein YraI
MQCPFLIVPVCRVGFGGSKGWFYIQYSGPKLRKIRVYGRI